MGVESEAELVDIELFKPLAADEVARRLNAQLPEGFTIIAAEIPAADVPSPSASVAASIYRVPLPETNLDLGQRITDFLSSELIEVVQIKKGREKRINLRNDVAAIEVIDNELELKLIKGSPLRLASYLLALDVETVRQLGVRKTAILLKV